MPRKTKDITENIQNKTTVKKATKSAEKESKPKTATKKVATKTALKGTKTKTSSKKASTKKSNTNTASKKTTNKSTKAKKVEILEYYDLPYRYNKTIVKILAQTPTTLFVYWDISDEDKNNYIKQYGEYFFNNTKPVLIIHNITKNYSYEIDINDFANSWYLHVQDSNCDYKIELGRRPINKYVSIPNNYLFISSSNDIESPNDHILFEELPDHVLFKNVKTNTVTQKAVIHYLVKLEESYNVKDFYKEMYKDENINFDKLTLNHPSSSSIFK